MCERCSGDDKGSRNDRARNLPQTFFSTKGYTQPGLCAPRLPPADAVCVASALSISQTLLAAVTRAVLAAVVAAVRLNAGTYDPATTVMTLGRKRTDRTLEAVKGVRRSLHVHFE